MTEPNPGTSRARVRTRRILSRLTYANVMSTFAAFVVLSGGAAYAANTIRSADIVNNQVFSADVRDDTLSGGGLTSVDLTADSVGSSEVVDSSLGQADLGTDSVGFQELAFGTVQQFTSVTQNVTAMDTVTAKEATVTCPGGGKVTGGGFVIAGPGGVNVPNVVAQRSYAVDDTTWLARGVVTSGTPTWAITVTANCVR